MVQTKWIKIYSSCNPKLRIDLSETSNRKTLKNESVRPVYEFAKSVTKISSKVRKPKTYKKAINDLIHGNRWRQAVNKVL